MSQPVISVEHLSKAYRIGVKEEIPDTLMGAMKNVITAPWKNFKALRRLNTSTDSPIPASSSPLPNPQSPIPNPSNPDTLWALRDVSFEINQGDVVGIIGRNGAGKSTLLKVLSRITEPTSGRVVIRGRVSSLLEVGTGFHPELTGRENVYMNGTILGMRKKEIDRKFDEIVDFSGVEKFLDTPTKRYSSGMQVRLAFAVAAHLEPEILIVDEVLAVGDAEFQKKCLGKMKDVSSTGQTVLFVSHNLGAVESLCSTCIWISDGKFQTKGDPNATIIEYLRAGSTPKPTNQRLLHDLFDSIEFKSDLPDGTVRMGGRVAFRLGIKSSQRPWELKIGISIEDRNGNRLLALSTEQQCPELLTSIKKISRLECEIDSIPFLPGRYYVTLLANDRNNSYLPVTNAGFFDVTPANVFNTGQIPSTNHGIIFHKARWSFSN